MPRSEAEDSSSDSDDNSRVAISDLSSPCRDDAGPSANPASDAAKLLCWAYLERSLRQNSTPKQVAAQMREYRKRHWRDTSRELQTDVCASLSAESSHDLDSGGYALRSGR